MKQSNPSKNIFVYPCTSYAGRAVAQAFAAAGHAVSGLATPGAEAPPCVGNVVRLGDASSASAQKQLLLTADVVVYDMLGHEKATREAVVQLAQQPFCGREVFFVALSSPLVWAATRPNPGSVFASTGEWEQQQGPGGSPASPLPPGAQPDGEGAAAGAAGGASGGLGMGDSEDAPWAGAGGGAGSRNGTGSGDGDADGERDEPPSSYMGVVPGQSNGSAPPTAGSGTGAAADGGAEGGIGGGEEGGGEDGGEGGAEGEDGASQVAPSSLQAPPTPMLMSPTFVAPGDVPRRTPGVAARTALAVEQVVLRAGRRGRLRTAVVCPGLLYGEGEDDQTFYSMFKAAWVRQCRVPPDYAPSRPPPCLRVYGRGSNILPTLHVADLASYVLSLSGLAPPPALPPAPPPTGSTSPTPPPLPLSAASTQQLPTTSGTGKPGSAAPPPPPQAASAGAGGAGAGPLPVSGYFLVTDGSRCSQGELVAAVAAEMGLEVAAGGSDEGAIEYIPDTELHHHPAPLRSRMLLDLSLVTTPLPPQLPPWSPSRPGGLPAHLPAIASEFRDIRRLNPLRILVTGPPLSGKTHLARRLAVQYGLAYINVPTLLAAAADPAVAAAAGLNPAMDPAVLRTAQAEVAAGLGPGGPPASKGGDKAGDTGWVGAGRVSAKTLGMLLASAVADPRAAARCRGFVLDGLPRSAAQARAAFHRCVADEVAVVAEASHGKVGHPRSKGAAAREALATPALSGAQADTYEVPPGFKLVVQPLTAPTHVVELDVPEDDLRLRLAAVAVAAEETVTKLSGEASALSDMSGTGKGSVRKAPGTGTGGPGGAAGKGAAGMLNRDAALAATLGHYSEAGFTRRLLTFQQWRAEDAADLAARTAAAEAAWEAEQVRKAEERAKAIAEASTLKAKRRRARAAAAAAAAGLLYPDESAAAAPLGLDNTGLSGLAGLAGLEDGEPLAAVGEDGASVAAAPTGPPELPQHGGLVAWSLAGGGRYLRLPNLTDPDGPMVTLPLQPPSLAALMSAGGGAAPVPGPPAVATTIAATAAAAAAAPAVAARLPSLASLERLVDVFIEDSRSSTSAHSSRPATVGGSPGGPRAMAAAEAEAAEAQARAAAAMAEAAAAASAEAAAAATAAAAAATAAGADESYKNRWRNSRGEAVRWYLMQRVMPVVTAALAEVAIARVAVGGNGLAGGGESSVNASAGLLNGGPSSGSNGGAVPLSGGAKDALMHVARALMTAAEAEEAAFVDPYANASYGIQLAKIEAKAAREAARAAAAVAKAEREAAARQQHTAEEPATP